MFGFVKIIKERNSLERELELYKYKYEKTKERLCKQSALSLQYEYLYKNEMQKRFELLRILYDYKKKKKEVDG